MNTSKLLLSLCILMLCGCNGSRTSESRDAIDSLTDASATVDTVDTVIDAKADTVCVDSLEKESEEAEEHLGDEYGYVTTRHNLTKTLYEVEFCGPKLKQDIAECVNSFDKRSEFLASAHYFNLETYVNIEALFGQDTVNYMVYNPMHEPILGYYVFGQRTAIVYKTPFAVNTNKNPINLEFKWYTWIVVDPSNAIIDVADDSGLYGFKINPEDYTPRDSSNIDEY